MGNAVVYFEVGAADDAPLVAFYGKVFGWQLREFPGGGYTMIDTAGGVGITGGIGKSQTGEPWSSFYVETDDPQATLDKAVSLGGSVVMPVTDVGEGMSIAMFNDPDGLLIGLVRWAKALTPSAGSGESVDWFEILGSDAARTQQFYAGLFGWKIDRSGIGDYAVVDTDSGKGIMGGIGGGVGTHLATVYAAVPDLRQTLARVEEMGGSRVATPAVDALKKAAREALYGSAEDINMGVFRDPAGNLFGLYQKG